MWFWFYQDWLLWTEIGIAAFIVLAYLLETSPLMQRLDAWQRKNLSECGWPFDVIAKMGSDGKQWSAASGRLDVKGYGPEVWKVDNQVPIPKFDYNNTFHGISDLDWHYLSKRLYKAGMSTDELIKAIKAITEARLNANK